MKTLQRFKQFGILSWILVLPVGFLGISMGMDVREAEGACVLKRSDVLAGINEKVPLEKLTEKYAGCVSADSQTVPTPPDPVPPDVKGQLITNTRDTSYEAIRSCGYHPQRKELACTIEIRQQFGFGGPPALQPAGSYEYVTFCFDYQDGAGLVPVNTNGVHLHDEQFGVNPMWYMSAVVPANARLFSLPLVGNTYRARAILSFGFPVGGCAAAPVFGNQADFRVRLDP